MAEKGKRAKSRKKRSAASKNKSQSAVSIKPEKHAPAALPGSFKLTAQVLAIMRTYWRPLLGIVVVYLILNVLFASGLSSLSTAVNDIKTNLNETTGNQHLAKGLSGFGSLVASAGVSGSASGSILQSILFIVESLVIIWALRHLLAGHKVGVKQSYYSSMYPLVPFVLVIFVIVLQLLPISLGSAVFSSILTSAVSSFSFTAWFGLIIFLILAGWSFYMLSASVFAMYIVTLPDMQPRAALRSAKKLVKNRRWQIIPKVLYLPLFVIVIMGVIILPLILFASFLVLPVFYFLSMLTVLFAHAYLYCLYRGLIA